MRLALTLIASLSLAACTTSGGPAPLSHAGDYPEATPFAEGSSADPTLAAERALAGEQSKLLLVVMGANWCHDSRALAGWLETPRFAQLVSTHYDVIYLDAGVPQIGEGLNQDLAAHFGVEDIEGTPTVLIITPEGELLNTPGDARSWRNASMRSEDEIFSWLESWTASEI